MNKKLFLVLLLLAAVVFTGCAPREESLVIAIPTDPDGFHPHQSLAAASAEIAFNIYEGLVKAAPDGSVAPAIASSWEISSDGLVYTFTLRDGVRFHNGRLLEPADVVYCLSRVIDPDITGKAREFSAVETIEADGNDIVITLSRPDAAFLALLTEFGASIYPPEAEEHLSTQPVGTGPFVLTTWNPNNELVLTRFEHYWNSELPMLDRVTLKIIPDPSTAVTSLRTGHVDLIPRLEPDYLHQVEDDESLVILEGPMNLVQLLVINNAREPFNTLEVRQAVAYAINRDEIIQGAAWGRGTPIGSNMSPAMDAWYVDVTDTYAHDPQKARDLLAQAGYPDGFSAVIHLPAPYPLHRSAGEIIVEQLAQVGIDLEIQVVEWSTWLEQIYSNSEFSLTVIGFTGKLDPHTVLGRYQSGSGRNFGNFNSPEYDQLLAQGLLETDFEARHQIYSRIQEILAEEVAGVFLMDPSQLVVMNKNLAGWQNYPVYVLDLSTLHWQDR